MTIEKSKVKKIFSFCLPHRNFFLICLSMTSAIFQAQAQSHITCNVKNCSSASDNTLEFDLYIVNDGLNGLKLNSLSYGVDINSGILVDEEDTLTWMSTGGSELPVAIVNTFSFSYSVSLMQLKFTTSAFAVNASTAPLLPLNIPLKVGHFLITNINHSWVHGSATDFHLNTTTGAGYSNTGAVVYIGDGSIATSLNTSITRAVGVECSILLNGKASSISHTVNIPPVLFLVDNAIDEDKKGTYDRDSHFIVYPNPTSGPFTIELRYPATRDEIATVEILNAIGQTIAHEETTASDGRLIKAISLKAAPAGVYTVQVRLDGKTFQSKLVYQY